MLVWHSVLDSSYNFSMLKSFHLNITESHHNITKIYLTYLRKTLDFLCQYWMLHICLPPFISSPSPPASILFILSKSPLGSMNRSLHSLISELFRSKPTDSNECLLQPYALCCSKGRLVWHSWAKAGVTGAILTDSNPRSRSINKIQP